MSNKTKAQAAMEYLVTYAWALVAVVILVSILIVVASGNVNAKTCSSFLNFVCKDIGVEGDSLVLVLQNATGQKITINPFSDITFDGVAGYAIISYNGAEYWLEEVSIEPGAIFTIKGSGRIFARQIGISYMGERTGLEKEVSSNIGSGINPAELQIEISNDWIDNDGDGDIDCQDEDVESCVYGFNSLNVHDNQSYIFYLAESNTIYDLPYKPKIESIILSLKANSTKLGDKTTIQYNGTQHQFPRIKKGINVFVVNLSEKNFSFYNPYIQIALDYQSDVSPAESFEDSINLAVIIAGPEQD